MKTTFMVDCGALRSPQVTVISGNGLLGGKMTYIISLKGGKGCQSGFKNLKNMTLIQISSKDTS